MLTVVVVLLEKKVDRVSWPHMLFDDFLDLFNIFSLIEVLGDLDK